MRKKEVLVSPTAKGKKHSLRSNFRAVNNPGLVSWALAVMPFCVLIAAEDSFTFQTALPSVALMSLAFVFSPSARKYTWHALVVMVGFIGIAALALCVTAIHDGYLLSSKSLLRLVMFSVIVWFYATAVSHQYTRFRASLRG